MHEVVKNYVFLSCSGFLNTLWHYLGFIQQIRVPTGNGNNQIVRFSAFRVIRVISHYIADTLCISVREGG